MLRFLLGVSLLWLCASAALAQGVRVSMSASSNRVAVGEPFAVEIRIETHGEEPDSIELPDFGQLQILARSTSRPFSFSFGFGGGQRARVKSETIYGFTLRATDVGAFSIRPAIVTLSGRRIASQALNIIAVDASNAPRGAVRGGPAGADDDDADDGPRDRSSEPPAVAEGQPVDGANVDPTMFLRSVIDKKRAYVGEQVTVTIYLYVRGQLSDNPSITREPTLDGFWSNDLLPMQRSMSATRQDLNGHSYSVYVLRRFAAFPLRTGKLEVGAPAVEVGVGGSIFDLLNGPGRPTRREGVKVSVEVLPLPTQPNAGQPVHTGTLLLEASLDGAQAKVGEAVTLRVVARGTGNLRGLSLPTPKLDKVDTLAPEIDDQVAVDHEVIGGTRTFRWLLLPRSAGDVQIPSFVVDVFDPVQAQFSSARSTPLTLHVSGTAAEPQQPADDASAGDSSASFGPVRSSSALSRRSPELDRRPFFWPTVLAAPLLLLSLFAIRSARQRLALARAGSQDTLQLREVDDKLALAEKATRSGDANGALSALASALKKALEVRLGEPVGGMTLRVLEAHLQSQAMDPKLSTRVVAQLSALERARFDPGAQGTLELNHALAGVRGLVSDLGRARNKRAA
ncbi:MAG: hypothetical protein JWN48_1033 [Myxococcaceae bacterium]|nr:hypothetical protein [Myxococcaceae bacterium]